MLSYFSKVFRLFLYTFSSEKVLAPRAFTPYVIPNLLLPLKHRQKKKIKAQSRKRSLTTPDLFPQTTNTEHTASAVPPQGCGAHLVTVEASSAHVTSFCRAFSHHYYSHSFSLASFGHSAFLLSFLYTIFFSLFYHFCPKGMR